MKIESIKAVQDCMKALNIHKSKEQSITVGAEFTNLKNLMSGSIDVIFNANWHCGNGPFLEFDETIKGFGLTYCVYKPGWYEIKYDEKHKTLSVEGNECSFSLGFKKK